MWKGYLLKLGWETEPAILSESLTETGKRSKSQCQFGSQSRLSRQTATAFPLRKSSSSRLTRRNACEMRSRWPC